MARLQWCAERDEIKGTFTYSGAVIMERGSMKITADQVVIHSKEDKITRVVATGVPARYTQIPRKDQEPVNASANKIDYKIAKNMLVLIENASLEQEGTSLSGSKIQYDVKKSIVKAGGGGKKSEKERVKMVIPPKSLSESESEFEPESEPEPEEAQ